MGLSDNSTEQNPPSPWFVFCRLFANCSQLLLGVMGIALIVDRVMPGRSLRAELVWAGVALPWVFLMRRLGATPKPRRPRAGARTLIFVFSFVCFSSAATFLAWWETAPLANTADSLVGTGLTAFFFAGFMSLSEKGMWVDGPPYALGDRFRQLFKL